MALLDKSAIISVPDLKRERVSVPEWGEGAEVIIQEMSALERDRLRAEMAAEGGTPVNLAAKVLVRCIVDEAGARLFVDEEAEALGKKSVAAIQRLFSVAQKLNVITGTADEDSIKN